jgi:uncharacterized protein YndB with AHSA1/START domain
MPPRSNHGFFKHYWKSNLSSLKYYSELGRNPDRKTLRARGLQEVELNHIYHRPQERVWTAITDPHEMDQWLSKKAEVDLKIGGSFTYGWDHGATEIIELKERELISYTWVIGDDTSTVSWELKPMGADKTKLRFRHFNISEKYPLRATSYNEGWYAFMLLLGLYLERGLRTNDWSNLNDDSNS